MDIKTQLKAIDERCKTLYALVLVSLDDGERTKYLTEMTQGLNERGMLMDRLITEIGDLT